MKAPRFVASSVVAIAVLGAIYSVISIRDHAGRHRAGKDAESTALSAVESKRAQALYASKCAACHGMDLQGGVGPSLEGVGKRRSLSKIAKIARQGKGRNKAVQMPAGLVNGEEARLLARWLITDRTVTP